MVRTARILVGVLTVASLVITGCESTQQTKLERNKALVRRINEEIWNQGNLQVVEELYAADVIRHFLPDGSEINGRSELRNHILSHREAFPDWAEEINLIIADGDFVAIQFTSTGTNTGSFLGNPPTGKQVRINEMVIFRIIDDKVREQWLLPDLLSLNQQLGLISQ